MIDEIIKKAVQLGVDVESVIAPAIEIAEQRLASDASTRPLTQALKDLAPIEIFDFWRGQGNTYLDGRSWIIREDGIDARSWGKHFWDACSSVRQNGWMAISQPNKTVPGIRFRKVLVDVRKHNYAKTTIMAQPVLLCSKCRRLSELNGDDMPAIDSMRELERYVLERLNLPRFITGFCGKKDCEFEYKWRLKKAKDRLIEIREAREELKKQKKEQAMTYVLLEIPKDKIDAKLADLEASGVEVLSQSTVGSTVRLFVKCGDWVGYHSHTGKPLDTRQKVYLMSHVNGLTKIGLSRNPSTREKTLQAEDPRLKLIWSVPGSRKMERRLHDIFGSVRVRGEWFNLRSHHIDWIKSLSNEDHHAITN